VDPGLNGAWAALTYNGGFLGTGEIPRFSKLLNGIAFSDILKQFNVRQFVIEQVHSMPKQGVASSFTFGASYGLCIGVACGHGLPITYVVPQRWKHHFRLLGKRKDFGVQRVVELMPEVASHLTLKRHHGRADAILMAKFFLDLAKTGGFV
jgi:crossover junction endodeoxyribonuclease RuvC